MSTPSVVAEIVEDAQAFLDGHADELTSLLEEIATLSAVPAPAPSPELAVLLAGASSPAAVRELRRRRPVPPPMRPGRVLAGLAAAAVSALAITGAAAVANELPAPMQRAVAHFSEDFLPYSFPRPVGDPPVGGWHRAGTSGTTGVVLPSPESGSPGAGASSGGLPDPLVEARTSGSAHGPAVTPGAPKSGGGRSTASSGSGGTHTPPGSGDRTHTGQVSDGGTHTTAKGHHYAGSGNAGKSTGHVVPPTPATGAPDPGTTAGPSAAQSSESSPSAGESASADGTAAQGTDPRHG